MPAVNHTPALPVESREKMKVIVEHGVRYDLSVTQLQALTRRLVESRPLGDKSYGFYVLDGGDQFSDIARAVEIDILGGEYGFSVREWAGHCALYEQRSKFILGVARQSEPVAIAVMRFVGDNVLNRLPSYHDMLDEDYGWEEEAVAKVEKKTRGMIFDIASMGVAAHIKNTRLGQHVILSMLYSLYKLARQRDAKWLLGIFDDHHMRSFSGIGLNIERVGMSKEYWGSLCTPFILNLDEFPTTMRAKNHDLAELLVNGQNARRRLADDFDFDTCLRPKP